MSAVPQTKTYVAQIVLWVGLLLALPLWREFHEPGHPAWNVFLAAFLIAIVIGAFLGVRHLQKSDIEVGEARFDTRNKDEGSGA